MTEAFDLNQDNLLLQLKNMPKPPISKELAKEIGFDQTKYEKIIQKLLIQISEVRRERMKENYLFQEKIKAMQNAGQNKNKKIVIKNNIKKNTKNLKINLNRPKSNYQSVRSSGYGLAQKKIDIFSTRNKKIVKVKANNNIPNNKLNNNPNINKKLIKKSKTNKFIKKPNNNVNIKEQQKNIINNNNKYNNNFNIKNKKENKNPSDNLKKIKNELDKIKNENKQLEEQYSQLKKQINNNIQKRNKSNIFKTNRQLIQKNIESISKSIINDLLYELIEDLKNIEDKEKEKENKKKKNIKNMYKHIIINEKFKAKPSQNLINRCEMNRHKFYEHLKLKGSFITKDIFKIYEDFVEEMSQEILEESLNYCIEQMDNFIRKMENPK